MGSGIIKLPQVLRAIFGMDFYASTSPYVWPYMLCIKFFVAYKKKFKQFII